MVQIFNSKKPFDYIVTKSQLLCPLKMPWIILSYLFPLTLSLVNYPSAFTWLLNGFLTGFLAWLIFSVLIYFHYYLDSEWSKRNFLSFHPHFWNFLQCHPTTLYRASKKFLWPGPSLPTQAHGIPLWGLWI